MNNNDKIEIQNHGVKCDTEGCDYKYAFAEHETYTDYLNKPCPKCGANLLTQEDHDMMMKLLGIMKEVNSSDFVQPALPQEIQDLINQLEDPDKKATLKVEFVDGIPVMSSDDAEVQGIIDAIVEYHESENELVAHLDNLEKQ